MHQKFPNDFRNFLATVLTESVGKVTYAKWTPELKVDAGMKSYNGSSLYIAATGGVTGPTPPTHKAGRYSDGSVDWIYFSEIRDLGFNTTLYGFIGRKSEWKQEPNSDPITLSVEEQYQTFNDIIALRKIQQGDLRFATQRVNWASGVVFPEYTDESETESYCHVMTSNREIYMCLESTGPSLVEPSNPSTRPFRTIDGYLWKYMGEVGIDDTISFLTNDLIPISYKEKNDLSMQYTTQSNAASGRVSHFKVVGQTFDLSFGTPVYELYDATGSQLDISVAFDTSLSIDINYPGVNFTKPPYILIKDSLAGGSGASGDVVISEGGQITAINKLRSGSGYANCRVIVVGDGTGAEASANVVSGSIQKFDVLSGGSGYTWARVFVVPGVSGAVARGVLEPRTGHSGNILHELRASYVIVNFKIGHNDYFDYENCQTFRQIGLVFGLRDVNGESANMDYYIGPAHTRYNQSNLNKIETKSGFIAYLANVEKIEKVPNQEEIYRVIIKL